MWTGGEKNGRMDEVEVACIRVSRSMNRKQGLVIVASRWLLGSLELWDLCIGGVIWWL